MPRVCTFSGIFSPHMAYILPEKKLGFPANKTLKKSDDNSFTILRTYHNQSSSKNCSSERDIQKRLRVSQVIRVLTREIWRNFPNL